MSGLTPNMPPNRFLEPVYEHLPKNRLRNYKRWMLQQILDQAGDDGHRPKPCRIPKQFVPGFIRWPLRACLLPFVLLDVFAQLVAKKIIRPPFKRVGHCKKRGNCCNYILIKKSRGFASKLDLFWHTQINGFYRRDDKLHEIDGMKIYVMGCRYLQKDGKCGSYLLRPTICRSWPRIEYFGKPQILKGCGFRAELKK